MLVCCLCRTTSCSLTPGTDFCVWLELESPEYKPVLTCINYIWADATMCTNSPVWLHEFYLTSNKCTYWYMAFDRNREEKNDLVMRKAKIFLWLIYQVRKIVIKTQIWQNTLFLASQKNCPTKRERKKTTAYESLVLPATNGALPSGCWNTYQALKRDRRDQSVGVRGKVRWKDTAATFTSPHL